MQIFRKEKQKNALDTPKRQHFIAEIFHIHNTQDKMRAFLDIIHKSFLYIYFHSHENESSLLLLALLVEIKRRYILFCGNGAYITPAMSAIIIPFHTSLLKIQLLLVWVKTE